MKYKNYSARCFNSGDYPLPGQPSCLIRRCSCKKFVKSTSQNKHSAKKKKKQIRVSKRAFASPYDQSRQEDVAEDQAAVNGGQRERAQRSVGVDRALQIRRPHERREVHHERQTDHQNVPGNAPSFAGPEAATLGSHFHKLSRRVQCFVQRHDSIHVSILITPPPSPLHCVTPVVQHVFLSFPSFFFF